MAGPRPKAGQHACFVRVTTLPSLLREHFCPQWVLCFCQAGLTEIIDLSDTDQRRLWEEVAHCCKVVRQHFPCDKLNVAAIGNVVRPGLEP